MTVYNCIIHLRGAERLLCVHIKHTSAWKPSSLTHFHLIEHTEIDTASLNHLESPWPEIIGGGIGLAFLFAAIVILIVLLCICTVVRRRKLKSKSSPVCNAKGVPLCMRSPDLQKYVYL